MRIQSIQRRSLGSARPAHVYTPLTRRASGPKPSPFAMHQPVIDSIRHDLARVAVLKVGQMEPLLDRMLHPPQTEPVSARRATSTLRLARTWRGAILPVAQEDFEQVVAALQQRIYNQLEDASCDVPHASFYLDDISVSTKILYHLATAWHERRVKKNEIVSLALLAKNRKVAWEATGLVHEALPTAEYERAEKVHGLLLDIDKLFAAGWSETYRRYWRPQHVFTYQQFEAMFAIVDGLTLRRFPRREVPDLVKETEAFFQGDVSKTLEQLVEKARGRCHYDFLENSLPAWVGVFLLYPERLLLAVADLVRLRRPEANNLSATMLQRLTHPLHGKFDVGEIYVDPFAQCFDLKQAVAGDFSPLQRRLLQHKAVGIYSPAVWTASVQETFVYFLMTQMLIHGGLQKPRVPVVEALGKEVLRTQVWAYVCSGLAVNRREVLAQRWARDAVKARVFVETRPTVLQAAALALFK